MKKHMTTVLALLAILLILETVNFYNFEKLPISKPTQTELFMDKIAEIETPGGGYHTVNRFGMMGRYQFSLNTVRAVGIKTTRNEFLNNKELQDTAMVRLMQINEKSLQHYITRYEGKTFKGIRITRASIIAGAHFAGAQGVRNFFSSDDPYGTVDANGTTLKKYMKYFSNFHLPPINNSIL